LFYSFNGLSWCDDFFNKKADLCRTAFSIFRLLNKEKAANFDDARGFSGMFRFLCFWHQHSFTGASLV
jgi:hypothetical protein